MRALEIHDLTLTLLFFDILKFGGFQDLIGKREIVFLEVVVFMILVRGVLRAAVWWTFEVSICTIFLVRITMILVVVSTASRMVMPIVSLVTIFRALSAGIWI